MGALCMGALGALVVFGGSPVTECIDGHVQVDSEDPETVVQNRLLKLFKDVETSTMEIAVRSSCLLVQ